MTNKLQPQYTESQKVFLSRLTALGVREHGATIYLTLLQEGRAMGGSKIALKTKLHRQYVYLALPELLAVGLIEEIPHGKHHKRYKAKAPIAVEQIGRKQAVEASDLAQDLQSISNIGNEQEFEVIQGERALRQHELQAVRHAKEGEEQFIIGSASEAFVELMGDTLPEYLTEKEHKGMVVHYLGPTHETRTYQNSFSGHPNQKFRVLDKLPNGVTHMIIDSTSVKFYTFLKPPLAYVIYSPIVAEHYKQFFMMLWEMGKEVS